MKKIIVIFFCFATLALTGCGTTKSSYSITAAGTWTDGTYTEAAKGKNGTFDVTMTITDGKITDIQTGANNETSDIGGKAISDLPPEMLKEQTYDVDVISGATITSNAIKNAVAKCLEHASED